MRRAAAARRIAAATVYGGGGLTAVGASVYGVLRAEAKFARRTIGAAHLRVPDATGWYGRGRPGPALRLALLGDSSAAGYGVATVEETPGAWLGSGVAERADRRVHLRAYPKVGAQSKDLAGQVTAALTGLPDVAIIYIGANDVTHAVLPAASVRHLTEAVRRLREAGVEVVVGTCPDLGTIQPLPPPLRQVARHWSRRLAAAQTIAVVEAGGRTVSLASILGAEFAAAPALLFGPDRFHPSARGYESLARVMVPSVLSALGFGETEEDVPRAGRGEAVLPIGYAAAKASESPGTEIDGTEVGGATRGVGGRWVTLMRRRLLPTGNAQTPDEADATEDLAAAPPATSPDQPSEDAGTPAEDSAGAPVQHDP